MTSHEAIDGGGGGGGGGGGSGGDDGTTDDGISVIPGSDLWGRIAPGFLTDGSVQKTLKQFAKNPRAFILGSILATLLNGVEQTVSMALDLVLFLFWGDDPATTAGQWGIADIPLATANVLTNAGFGAGTAIIDAVNGVIMQFFAMTESLGIFGPPVAAAISVAAIVAILWISETVLKIIIDAIPGGGGLL